MSLVVGISPEERSRAALHLGTILARSSGDDLILCAVVPRPWPPSPARVDAEYRAHLDRAAEEVLDEARAQLDPDITVTPLVHHARSAAAGLLEVAEQHDTSVIVVGSSSEGVVGRVALGSVSSRLMHSAPVPVALPPRGYRCKPVDRVARVTAAYGGPDGGDELVLAAASVAARVGAGLRIASFAVRARPPYTSGVGSQPERAIIDQWAEEIKTASRAALEQVEHLPAVSPELEAEIGYGESWEEALEDIDWQDGDVLVVGSSAMGPIARVFLGSRASKIVRNSSVPAVVVPRGAAAELADQAVRAEAGRA
jgi:nucleotide-binding universal stress UspA family protein